MVADTDSPPPRPISLLEYNNQGLRGSLVEIFNRKLASARSTIALDATRIDIGPARFAGWGTFIWNYHGRAGVGMPWNVQTNKWHEDYVQLLFFADELESALTASISKFIAVHSKEPAKVIYGGNVTETAMRNYVLRRSKV